MLAIRNVRIFSSFNASLPLSRNRVIRTNFGESYNASERSSVITKRRFTPSSIKLERMKISVPTMGDSITEGTIVEWTAVIGSYVNEGEVIAMIETDKVSVEIKAEMSGVILNHYGSVDDTVEVGADLYQIDTEGQPTENVEETQEEEVVSLSSDSVGDNTVVPKAQKRNSSIHFLGKEGWKARRTPKESIPEIIYFNDPMYGRPVITEEEMEEFILGGASLAPKIITESQAPVFG